MANRENNNNENSRRKFIGQSAIAGLGLALAPALMSASVKESQVNNPNSDKKDKMTTRNLGNLKVSALGAGWPCRSLPPSLHEEKPSVHVMIVTCKV